MDSSMLDRTLIYYTANTELPEFEARIMADLKQKAGGIPIISVSREPTNLGMNICVGETPVCYMNEWRQLLIGLKAAETRFCLTAEADCLYPPSYFNFTPERDDIIHYYENLWIVWKHHNGFWQKTGHCEGAEMCGREYWISRLEPLLGEGWEPATRGIESALVKQFFPQERTWTGDPVISFKTGAGVSCRTTFINKKVFEIPYWGNINEVKRIFAP